MKYLICFLSLYIPWSLAKKVPSSPYFILQPPNDEILFKVDQSDYERPLDIQCKAIGEPAPRYYWIKNGEPFQWENHENISQLPNAGTLIISNPTDTDIGQYQCFAENPYGIATSNSVFVRQVELNSFESVEKSQVTGNEGEPFKLAAKLSGGWPKPIVSWVYIYSNGAMKSINSSRLTVDPEGNLWFSNLTKADATDNNSGAAYVVGAVNNYEYKLGPRVILNVRPSGLSENQHRYPPVLQYATKRDEVAYKGKSAQLFCIFGGTPLPDTIWYKNGSLVKYSEKIIRTHFGKGLLIKNVDFDYEKWIYTCEVSNGVGETMSHSMNLKVLAAPYFTKEPKFILAAENETVEFICEAGGVPEPEINWIHNGKPLSEAPTNPRRKVYRNRIVIEGLVKNDIGNYGCNASNSLGYVYKDVRVNVLDLSPEINTPPTDTRVVDNQNVTMSCDVLGVPKPNIKWLRDAEELTGGRYKVQQNGDLHISSADFSDEGNYTCHATNKFGNASASAMLDIKSRTYISHVPEDYEAAEGERATFSCTAISDDSLDLEILWLINEQPIDFDSEFRFIKATDNSLFITKTRMVDSGTYTCLARTELDEASAEAQLIVQDIPNPPDINVVCHIIDATINWRPMGDNRSPISYYRIQYNTSFTPEIWRDVTEQLPSTSTSYNFHMTPWANYTFRVIAVNKIGPSLPSFHSDVCTTAPDVPYKNPENVNTVEGDPHTLVITWTPLPQIEHHAPGFKYRIYYKRDIQDQVYQFIDVLDYRQNSFTMKVEPSFEKYRIKITAVNDVGESKNSPNEVVGYSGQNVPELAPTNITLVKITGPTTALLSWNPVPPKSANGYFRGYLIKTWSDISHAIKEIKVPGDTTKHLLTNLDPYTTNSVAICAFNDKYDGPTSEVFYFAMPEGIPLQVQDLEAFPLGSTAFMLTWKAPARLNGELIGYDIYYAEVRDIDVGVNNRKIPQTNPDITHAKLSGLSPSTKYRISVTASTRVGESKVNFIERLTPSPGYTLPSKPTFDWEIIRGEPFTMLKITWIPNLNKNPGSHFFVHYRNKGEPQYNLTSPEEREDFLLMPILDDALYDIVVVSVDGSFETPSDPQEISTYTIFEPIFPVEENGTTTKTLLINGTNTASNRLNNTLHSVKTLITTPDVPVTPTSNNKSDSITISVSSKLDAPTTSKLDALISMSIEPKEPVIPPTVNHTIVTEIPDYEIDYYDH